MDIYWNCPNCGEYNYDEYDEDTGILLCEECDYEFILQELSDYYEVPDD